MKKLLLLMVLLPFGAYCANTLTMFHINDGPHVLQQGQTFTANEIVVSNSRIKDIDSVKNVICTSMDTASIAGVKMKWVIVVNDYSWSYNVSDYALITANFLPSKDVVYKMVITGVIDKSIYKGPYATIQCRSLT